MMHPILQPSSVNGQEDPNNHWSDDGSKSSSVTDVDVSKDGSRREHAVETRTDKDGNTETWDTYKLSCDQRSHMS